MLWFFESVALDIARKTPHQEFTRRDFCIRYAGCRGRDLPDHPRTAGNDRETQGEENDASLPHYAHTLKRSRKVRAARCALRPGQTLSL